MERLPASVDEYLRTLARILARELGDDLTAAYLHGSAALGGFRLDRSDVDVLVVVERSLPRARLRRLAAAVGHAGLPDPACGLELDVITREAALQPRHPSPLELNLFTSAERHEVHLGADIGTSTDIVLHLAVVAVAGVALAGPPPADAIGEVPRAWVAAELRNELAWGLDHASPAYQALNAARAWRFAEEGVVCGKIEGGMWALGRGHDRVIRDAIAFQEGRTERAPDPAAAATLVRVVRDRLALV
jgi:Nucleotidyltransferase domain/Aminoglycoside adenylyltransferase, C-terminal domain